jgi:transcriptional regulator with XRE-family HTH domain
VANVFVLLDILMSHSLYFFFKMGQMSDNEMLYQAVGEKIRHVRERSKPKLSQAQLATRLGVSRASIVNIEAGRQHAPLHLLWQIAGVLDTELSLLIPQRDELLETQAPIKLDRQIISQIEDVANGDPDTRRWLTGFISKAKSTIGRHVLKEDDSA